MIHKLILLLILIINYFSIGFSGLYEDFEEYRSNLLSKRKNKNMNYFKLQNNIETKYFKCLEHYNQYVKPIQDKTNSNSIENVEDIMFLENNDITFENYLEYWWNLEESEDELLNRVCIYINKRYPKKYIRLGK
jgi:hypothetical protein